ncbi:MAG: aminotransferase class III-fold pyridoxal phosphate-dependent enzyme [Hyphomicrobiaceae bacterium]|nr:aminotransferase class III-fold pyridoxal phosphate-dependent enzyme [Hyphomicrobiaceae bacterium]
MQTLSNSAIRDLETLLHPATNLAAHRSLGPTIIDRGEGIHVWDTSGKRYIEGLAGLWCASLGYGNNELIEAAREQMSRLSFSHLFGGRSHEPAIELAEKIKEISPAPTSKVFFTCSGSEANDTQIKLAWYYNNARGKPQKKKIISREKAYHGVTIATASLTGLGVFHQDFDLPMARIIHADCPHHWRNAEPGESEEDYATRLAANLESLIEREDPDTIAAFIAEPVMGAGGVIVPPATYFEKIQAVLKRHDIALIVDEVICGFGRTGNMFGSQTYGITPDTVTMAKAITSAYMPLGAVTVSEDVYQAMLDESRKIGVFAHGFTYTGHPVACAVAVKTLEIYQRLDIVAHVQRVAPIFAMRLKALSDHPLVGEARGVGLIGGLQLVADKKAKAAFPPEKGVGGKAVQFCQEEGLILRALGGDVLAVCPPLIIDGAGINELFDSLERGLDKTLAWLRS